MVRVPYAPKNDWKEESIGDSSEETGDDDFDTRSEFVSRKSQDKFEKKAKWLSGSWKLDQFNDKCPITERKAEWKKYRDQFELICDCKVPVDPETKLNGMKIHAGDFLKKIIEMQEATVARDVDDIYAATVKLVNCYFEATCSKTQERINYRQLKQKDDENFADWVLRLESQSQFCDFEEELRKEEFMQALITRSVPELAEKLFEASSFFENDISKLIKHGQHLDVMRINKANDKLPKTMKAEESDDNVRPVMWVAGKNVSSSRDRKENRTEPYQASRYKRDNEFKPRNWVPTNKDCERCGRRHIPSRCPAFRSKCNNCNKYGHWATKCRMSSRDRRWEKDNKDVMFEHVNQINKVETE